MRAPPAAHDTGVDAQAYQAKHATRPGTQAVTGGDVPEACRSLNLRRKFEGIRRPGHAKPGRDRPRGRREAAASEDLNSRISPEPGSIL
jgi:hypothetical protein